MQEINAESQENVSESDSTHLPTSAQPQDPEIEFVKINLSEQDQSKPGQTVTQPELLKNAQEIPKEVKDQGVQDAKVSPRDLHDVPNSLNEKEYAVKMTSAEVPESCTESVSEPSVIPGAQTERHTSEIKENKKEDQEEGEKGTIQEEEREKTAKEEIQNVPLPMAMTGEVRPLSMKSPKVRHFISTQLHMI